MVVDGFGGWQRDFAQGEGGDGAGERVGVARWEEEAVAAGGDEAGRATKIAGDDELAGVEGFQEDEGGVVEADLGIENNIDLTQK